MTILKSGTFKVSDFRKAIPAMTKVTCVLNQDGKCSCGKKLMPDGIDFDHTPSLNQRDYDTEAGDFIPPQNDAAFIIARHTDCHAVKTFGLGGERRVHTRGSDRSEPGRLDKIAVRHTEHLTRVTMLLKGAVEDAKEEAAKRAADAVRQMLRPTPKVERKSKWPSRPFNKSKKKGKSR